MCKASFAGFAPKIGKNSEFKVKIGILGSEQKELNSFATRPNNNQ